MHFAPSHILHILAGLDFFYYGFCLLSLSCSNRSGHCVLCDAMSQAHHTTATDRQPQHQHHKIAHHRGFSQSSSIVQQARQEIQVRLPLRSRPTETEEPDILGHH